MKIFDLHNDFLTKKSKKASLHYINTLATTDIKKIMSVVWSSNLDETKVLDLLEFISKNGTDKTALAIEDLHFITPLNYPNLLKYNPFYVSLTWNKENNLAGGVDVLSGLSGFGEKIVQILQEHNIIIDTAHINERGFLDVAKISTKPIICSHTGFYAQEETCRNLKDYQIKIIEDSGGIVGLYFVSHYLTPRRTANIDDVIRHIIYFCTHFNINNLALGTDFFGTNHLPQKLHNYKDISNLTDVLKKKGFLDTEIEKIIYKNAERFYIAQRFNM